MYQHIIKPVCEKCGFVAQRVDEFNTSGSITQEILDALNDYELVIADLTGHNPNVFFEIGYRTKSQKPIIHLKRKDEIIPVHGWAGGYDLNNRISGQPCKVKIIRTNTAENKPLCWKNGKIEEKGFPQRREQRIHKSQS